MNANKRLNEHYAGWDVIENGVKLFSLEFITSDQPFYRFKVIDVNCPQENIKQILNSAGREPREGLVYKNRLSQSIIPDEWFCGGYHDDVAGIRDFRPRRIGAIESTLKYITPFFIPLWMIGYPLYCYRSEYGTWLPNESDRTFEFSSSGPWGNDVAIIFILSSVLGIVIHLHTGLTRQKNRPAPR
jgi:hypothetical protein